MNATEEFDKLAEQFYRDTGIMAPGKSVPLEWSNRWTDEERWEAWKKWRSERANFGR